MSEITKIEWTDTTWNPVTGCTRVSEGCRNCYIERTPPFRIAGRKFVNGSTGVQLHPDRLEQPLHWKKPRLIFVNSLSDLFHPSIPASFIVQVFEVMAACPQHTFQVLTKRPERIEPVLYGAGGHFYLGGGDYFPNVLLGISAENQQTFDTRWGVFKKRPGKRCSWAYALRLFVSLEPLLGSVDIRAALAGDTKLSWVICGGESGPKARPMHPDWARSVRDQCQAAVVPFFFKQWGEWAPHVLPWDVDEVETAKASGIPPWKENAQTVAMLKVHKKAAGRLLDGREWSEFPKVSTALRRRHKTGRKRSQVKGGLHDDAQPRSGSETAAGDRDRDRPDRRQARRRQE